MLWPLLLLASGAWSSARGEWTCLMGGGSLLRPLLPLASGAWSSIPGVGVPG